jgi:predicted RND superfamily exporter protein
LRLFRVLTKHPLLVVLLTAALGLLGTYLSSRLKFRTSFAELLPEGDPGVQALHRTEKRIGDLTLLLVGVRSPDVTASERYAEALTARLRSLPPTVVDIAAYHIRDIFDFVEDHRWLYASQADLVEVRDRIRREVLRRKNPLVLDLSDDEEQGQQDKALEQRLKKAIPLQGRFPGGLFRNPSSKTVWVTALPPGGLLVENAGEALLAATQQFIRETPPARFHPQMEVQMAGPIITSIRNREALQRDLVLVATLCALLIPLSMALYFRRARAVLFVAVPAVMATVLAYAVAYLAFGYLTTVTSFLVSFVMGNGTNYAVVLLARYEEQRRHGDSVRVAALHACGALWRTTGVAALASALSYGSLMITSFRGFSQFGAIGAAGCLLAWAMTFTLMPAMLCLLDGRGPRQHAPGRAPTLLVGLGSFIERRPRLVLAVGSALTLFLAIGAARMGRETFEYDFRKLSARGIIDETGRQFDEDYTALFGRWPQPTVVLADRPEDVEPLRTAIRQADRSLPRPQVIGDIITVWDLLPGRPEVQREKLTLLAQIRKLIDDPAMELVEEKTRQDMQRLRPPDTLRALGPGDLPPLARRPFTEVDGTMGRVLLIYPPEQGVTLYDGRILLRIAAVLQKITLPDGRQVESSGSAVIFAGMIRSVLHDGPLASFASLTAVLLLVLLRVRPRRAALFVMGGLLAGVVWMVGIAGWLGIKITFLNFIALPFIFGVGVEYAIHVVSEWKEHGSVRRTVGSAGGAVALCSWSAIVGYGSLLVARNGALQGLGAMATVGETTCLLAAVILTPAALVLASRGGRQAGAGGGAGASAEASEPRRRSQVSGG